jgi:hypothetical protein
MHQAPSEPWHALAQVCYRGLMCTRPRDTFVEAALASTLKYFTWISFFYWLNRWAATRFFWVNIYVLSWLATSLIFYTASFFCQNWYVQIAAFAISAIRMWEYLIFIFNVMLFVVIFFDLKLLALQLLIFV